MNKILDRFVPESVTPLVQMRARVLAATCLAVSAAILATLLYWIIFSWLEQWLTVVIGLIFVLFLGGLLALIKRGWVRGVAWTLTLFLVLLNLANMISYGIGTTSSAGFLLAIVLAAFTLGPRLGLGVAALGSIAAFGIALAGASGALKTEIPFQESNLSFDALTLTLIYLLVGLMCAAGLGNNKS